MTLRANARGAVVLSIVAALSLTVALSREEGNPVWLGPERIVAWDHDGKDVGGSGLSHFELQGLDDGGDVVYVTSAPHEEREVKLGEIPDAVRSIRIRCVDNASNPSEWAMLEDSISGVDSKRPEPPRGLLLIKITLEVSR